ncbi:MULTISPECIES: CBO0543 family protein [unclassified Bacillus (in: firmicutes)]|uniref:CBO0543 family protein n=1 Tax=unclassified Bacillus (in: firmicutes) TaxID=185979 RepID=UPI001BE510BA|nr:MULTISPECIES: CBO0543 family protein [unclassified Bacillus (in: firmicutes)]MBT2615507.1 hypothetical protein [Bacillus sp. ISL-78]MBT2632334.1 hypothetical protein [Bacillus sp. ISL-101]MBT2719036.1 hypothetical protein [Bacillus sp. ISL-57]
MFFNTILIFVIPWIIGIFHLYKKDKLLIPLIGSFFSVIAFTINELGFYFGFWEVAPFPNQKTLSASPFNLGIYPILASYMIFFIKKNKNLYLVVFFITLFTTFLEMIFVFWGKVIYGNGWNTYFTFISYLFPYTLTYWYYIYLKKLNVLT